MPETFKPGQLVRYGRGVYRVVGDDGAGWVAVDPMNGDPPRECPREWLVPIETSTVTVEVPDE